MAEKLKIYSLDSELLWVQDRGEFYDEIKQEYNDSKKITRKVETIRLILMNSSGNIYLQKRNKDKSENGGLYDKSVGGHVKSTDSYELTVVKECAEELWFPATVLRWEDFKSAIEGADMSIVWVFRQVELLKNFMSTRVLQDGAQLEQPFISSMYVGYYDGPMQFVDWESSWIEVFSLSELEEEIIENPNKFTQDIKFMVSRYKKYLVPLSRIYTQNW